MASTSKAADVEMASTSKAADQMPQPQRPKLYRSKFRAASKAASTTSLPPTSESASRANLPSTEAPRSNPPYVWITTSFQNVSARVSSSYVSLLDRIQNYFNPPTPIFDDEDIAEFMTLTYLSKEEILRAYKNFVRRQPQFFDGDKNPYLPRYKAMSMPEFKVNPFRERMMNTIASYEDFITFEDYLEMMSVFSEQAPIELKAEYAFRICDFDLDDCISLEDLVELIKRLTDFNLEINEADIENAAAQALIDGDVDGDGLLAFVEFLHLIKRLDDFKSCFTIHA